MRRRSVFALSIILLAVGSVPAGPESKAPPYDSSTPLREPTLFVRDIVSTGDDESHPAFTPDGRTLYFLKNTPTFDFWTIVVSRFQDDRWQEPQVAPFSGLTSDADPFVTRDGSKLFFISTRRAPGKTTDDLDLWVVERSGTDWGEPQRLPEPVNSPGSEWFPTVADDGTLYFGSDREGGLGETDLYRCRLVNGRYGAPEPLGSPVNSSADEVEPCIAPDQSFLIFAAAGRPGARGTFDLYLSEARDGGWSEPVALGGGVNSPAWDFSPRLTPDGKYLFFTSSRRLDRKKPDRPRTYPELIRKLRGPGNGLRDIYQIELSAARVTTPPAAER